jgi:UDP-glucose 4-epimerase
MVSFDEGHKFAGARCLITGGAGFIGSNLTRALIQLGASVHVLDDFSTGTEANLPRHQRLQITREDLRHSERLNQILSGVDYVFHLAAQVGNMKSIASPTRDAETNIIGTVRVIEACRGVPIRKFVYSSSSAIFGEATGLPVAEDHPQAPASFYALSKQAGERYARMAAELLRVPAVCLRYFNVYGLPMEESEYSGVIGIFLRRLRAAAVLTIYGDGAQIRDFVHVDGVVQANLLAALYGGPGGVYNIGTGAGTTIRDLAEILADVMEQPLRVEYAGFRAGEVRRSVADITRARIELGYAPRVSLREGLQQLVDRPLAPVSRDEEM